MGPDGFLVAGRNWSMYLLLNTFIASLAQSSEHHTHISILLSPKSCELETSMSPSLKWAWMAVLAKGFGNEGEALCFADRCAATTTRPSTLPATSLPPSVHWRAPRRATNSTWTTSGLANVSLSSGPAKPPISGRRHQPGTDAGSATSVLCDLGHLSSPV